MKGDKKILKSVLRTRLKTKETTYTLVFGNTLLSLSEGIFIVFGRFIEKYLRNLTCWEKSKKQIRIQKNRWYFSEDYFFNIFVGSVVAKENVSKILQTFVLFRLVHWCRSTLLAIIIQNILYLVENWWFKKKNIENTNRLSYTIVKKKILQILTKFSSSISSFVEPCQF
jgi:hypothetical protein